MLFRVHDDGAEPWSTGAAEYLVRQQWQAHRIVTAVRCRFGTQDGAVLALLDTGSDLSVVGGSHLAALEEDLGEPLGELCWIHTRLGSISGHLRELTVTLIAQQGEDLAVDGCVLAAEAWHGPPVIGLTGVLEWTRIALEPTESDGGIFYFGPGMASEPQP